MPKSFKVATFANEVIGRLKTSHLEMNRKDMEKILLDLMDDLAAMGYAQKRFSKQP